MVSSLDDKMLSLNEAIQTCVLEQEEKENRTNEEKSELIYSGFLLGKCYFQGIIGKGKYMKYQNIRVGHFISRPNRFIAKIEIEGAEETVHVKNTGRCAELLVPGQKSMSRTASRKPKTGCQIMNFYKVKCRWRLVQNLRILGKNVRRAGT